MKPNKPIVSLERFREVLDYDPVTGNLSWKVYMNRKARPGDIAGTKVKAGYIQLHVDSQCYVAHQIAWYLHYGVWSDSELDHENGVRWDNSISNLRKATRSLQGANRCVQPNNSGFKGVSRSKNGQRWHAHIAKDKKIRHLGTFDSPEIAAIVYDITALELFGKFAKTNF